MIGGPTLAIAFEDEELRRILKEIFIMADSVVIFRSSPL